MLRPNDELVEKAAEVLGAELPNWGMLLNVSAFNVPKDLAMNPDTLEPLQRRSGPFGLYPERAEGEYTDLCPLRTSSRHKRPTLRTVLLSLGSNRSHSRRERPGASTISHSRTC